MSTNRPAVPSALTAHSGVRRFFALSVVTAVVGIIALAVATCLPDRSFAVDLASFTSHPADAGVRADFLAPNRLRANEAVTGAGVVAARRAAEEAAAAARAQAAQMAARAVATAGTINVWTTGFQTQINQCRGGVDVTAAYGTRAIAEHWQCGGSTFPTTAGSIVHVTGIDAGTYRVIGVVAVLNAYVAHTSQLPHGYQLLFQTCRNGDSHYTEFVALQSIG